MKTLIELRNEALLTRAKVVNTLQDAGYTGTIDGVSLVDLVDALSVSVVSGEIAPLNMAEVSCHQTLKSGEMDILTGYRTLPSWNSISYFIPVSMYNCSYGNQPIEQISVYFPESHTIDELRVATYRALSGETKLQRIDEVSLGQVGIVGGVFNRLILPRPISGELGCFPAVSLNKDDSEDPAHLAVPEGAVVAQKDYTAVDLVAGDGNSAVRFFSWPSLTIRSYARSPDLMSIGNSISMGKGSEDDTTRGITNWMQAYEALYFVERQLNPDYYAASHIATAYNWTYTIGGKRTLHDIAGEAAVYTSFAQLVSARHPRYVLMMFGINENDLYHPEESAGILANLMDLVFDLNARPLVMSSLFAETVLGYNPYVITQNAGFQTVVESRASRGAIWLDPNPVICPSGYLPAAYAASDHLHLILSGYQALGAELVRLLRLTDVS